MPTSRVIAVFSPDPDSTRRAVRHLRSGAEGVPIWLFTTATPPDEANYCQQVHVRSGAARLLTVALRLLARRRVALAVAAWTGRRGGRLLKVAPFLFPPWRVLVLNRHGDFFAGDPGGIARHHRARMRDLLLTARDVLRAGFLQVLLFLAPVLRALFHRVHGADVLELATLSRGESVDHFVPESTVWNGSALERFARQSTARWILWGPGDVRPTISDGRTFAVAPQRFQRGWRPFLFPTAPFRQLQRGEASLVVAPVADTILVDRLKLLALGVPRCRRAGAAWRLLFWQAAAAGWTSYSVGTGAAVPEHPDDPAAETEFLLRAFRDRRLRRLGPRDTRLSRGNIAFSSTAAPKRSGARLKVLVVSPFLPYPLSHGGAVRMFNLCRSLAGRVDFTLIAVREKDETVHYDRLREIFRDIYVVDLDNVPPRSEQPRMADHYRSETLRALVSEVARRWRPDLLQIEYTQMAPYRDCAPHTPAILVEHDVTFTLYRQFAESAPSEEAWAEYARWLAFERRRLCGYDAVWTMSQADRELVVREGRGARRPTRVIPNGVDTRWYLPGEESTDAPEILFVGSFRHLPNLIGFDRMAHEIMPRVWREWPQARLRVVAGMRHEPFREEFAKRHGRPPLDARIDVHGFVSDLRPLYARAAVVAAPLAVSAGTNIKVLEAMACGKAVAATPPGCSGLDLVDGHDVVICQESQPFAEAVNALLADAGLRGSLGRHARETVEARFSWDRIAAAAYESYRELSLQSPDRLAPHDIRIPNEPAAIS